MIKDYQGFIKVNELVDDMYDISNFKIPENPHKDKSEEELTQEYIKELGREGKLVDYLKEHNQKLTFGLFKIVFDDALAYKKRRTLRKGFYKMVTRAIPMALSFVFLPLSMIALALGASRAVDKILYPVLTDPGNDYNEFLKKMLITSFNLIEGDYKMFMEKDWFYEAVGINRDLKHLIKIEHLMAFSVELAKKIEAEPPEKVVPKKYVENQLKIWIRENFKITIVT